ncbi:MAG: hypothetical protein ACR2JB_05295 [Bryobacteraceae bacterium]
MITPSIAGGVPEANPSTKTHGAINRGIFNQILLGKELPQAKPAATNSNAIIRNTCRMSEKMGVLTAISKITPVAITAASKSNRIAFAKSLFVLHLA